MNKALLSSKNMCWCTPQDFFDPLDTLGEKAEQLGVPEGFEAVPDDDIPF